jgi:DNA-directed RNA polymerase I subunit RPA1
VNIGTEGCNIQEIWEFSDEIDVDNIYTNDISAVLHTYGVEAARQAITAEVAAVFGVYGIAVDRRHLSLISDYMTFEGGYKPFNRMGMNSNPSPFAQMSFETTAAFLTQATLSGDFDTLESPSARLVLGQVVKGGTGAFDILQPIQ